MPQSIGNHNYQVFARNSAGVYSQPISISTNVVACGGSSITPGFYVPYTELNPVAINYIYQFGVDGNPTNPTFITIPLGQLGFSAGQVNTPIGSDSQGNIFANIGNAILKITNGVTTRLATLPSSSSRYVFTMTPDGGMIAMNEGLSTEATTLYRISTTGAITTFGNFPAGYIGEIVRDTLGNIYLAGGNAAGYRTGVILKINPQGVTSEFTLNIPERQIESMVIQAGTNDLFISTISQNSPFTAKISKLSSSGVLSQGLINLPAENGATITADRVGNLYSIRNVSNVIDKVNLADNTTIPFVTSSFLSAFPRVAGYDNSNNMYLIAFTQAGQQPSGGTEVALARVTPTGQITILSAGLGLTGKTFGGSINGKYLPSN